MQKIQSQTCIYAEGASANSEIRLGSARKVGEHKPTQAKGGATCSFPIPVGPRNESVFGKVLLGFFDLRFGAYLGPWAANDRTIVVTSSSSEYVYHVH